MWASKPASLDRWRSSSCPQPVRATSTRSLPHGCFADAAAHLVAVQARAGRCRAAPRRDGAARRLRAPATPSCALCVSWPPSCNSMASDSAPSSLSSTIRMRRPHRRRGVAAAGCGTRLGASGQDRQANDELAAAAESVAVGLDRPAVHLHQRLHQRQADAQAVARTLQRRIHLREHVEEARQAARRRCRCRCPARG